MSDHPEARPEDLAIALAWQHTDDGALSGRLTVRNVSDHPVRVSHKPGLQPLAADGHRLDATCIVTAELRDPNHVVLEPGQQAQAPVGWAGWDGPPAGGDVHVTLAGGATTVTVDGPAQPASRGPATNLWSSWFQAVDG
jgi:hypothetical protein